MVRDLSGSVNQSSFFSIFLKSISILFIFIPFVKNSLFEANKYFNDQEPWNKKEDLLRLNTIVFTTLEIVRKVSFLLYPIIPESSIKALKIFGINEADINLSSLENNDFLSKVDKIYKIDILFKKIEKKDD